MASSFKNVLCIRADNMGDLLMSSPAIRAVKETFGSKITVLTSSYTAPVVNYIKEIDEVISCSIPWVKTAGTEEKSDFFAVAEALKKRRFDAAIIFTVYSQSPLPAAVLAYQADIPVRLAYCRENPYDLLTHWVPDKEPYAFIRHQVQRDLALTSFLGASVRDDTIRITANENGWPALQEKLIQKGISLHKPWILLHPGVSETKREYPQKLWLALAQQLKPDFQLLFTGSKAEKALTDDLQAQTGTGAFSLGGLLSLDEFMLLIQKSPMVISVNTLTIHLAAALNTPQVVLYALTNPQHLPWKASGRVFYFTVPDGLKSKNEIIRFVDERYFPDFLPWPQPEAITAAVQDIVSGKPVPRFPQLALQ